MNDRFTPPPRRTLPPEIRDRIRGAVSAGLEPAPVSRIERLRTPLAAAASVAVLAAGAMIVAQSVTGGGGGVGTPTTAPTTTSGATLNLAEANAELDRCWAGVQQAGKAEQFPDRSLWRPVFNYSFYAVTVTAARASGKPLFCETTPTSVTVSDPNASPAYAPGSRTGTVLYSRQGTIAGVLDPSWRGMWIEAVGTDGGWRAPATVKDGLFLTHGPGSTTPGSAYNVGEAPPPEDGPAGEPGPWLSLPQPAQAPISVIDRPSVPAPDRASARGQVLDECINTVSAVIDAESWQPGATRQDGDDRVVMARNAYGFSVCWQVDGHAGFEGYRIQPDAANGPTPTSLGLIPGSAMRDPSNILAGVVPAACVRMQVLLPNGGTVEADVANATFAVALPADAVGPGKPKTPTVRLYDSADKLLYEGPLDR